MAAYRSIQTYCDDLIEKNDEYGEQILKEFGDGDGTYTNEYGMTLAASDFSFGHNDKIKWTCSKNSKHTWYASPNDRTSTHRHGCPYCSGQKVLIGDNDFKTYCIQHPEYKHIIDEWDYEKNNITPEEVTPGSNKPIQFKCKYGHYWTSTLKKRTTKNSNCPFCNNQTSFPEQLIYWSFKQLYNTENRKILFRTEENKRGYEYDIYIKELNTLIEYSGQYYHEGREERDQKKKELAISNNYNFIDIIEKESGEEVYTPNHIEVICDKTNKEDLINYILGLFNHSISDIDIIQAQSQALQYSTGSIEFEKSLAYLHPQLALEWDYEENEITPEQVTPGKHAKVKWVCPKGHKYEAKIHDRTDGTGCMQCYQNKLRAKKAVLDIKIF